MAYLEASDFKARTLMPAGDVDAITAQDSEYLPNRLEMRSRWIDSRLAKRYAAPFDEADPPTAVVLWLVDLVTLDMFMRRGFNPESAQDKLIVDAAEQAKADIKEAADSKDGLFELPLKQSDPAACGVSKGGPLGQSQASPWTWTDVQADAAHDEDANGWDGS